MDTKTIIALVILFVVIVLGAFLIATPSSEDVEDGKIVYDPFISENVKVSLPFPDAIVLKEFIVSGEARGTWFFEASFPIQVLDRDGNVISTGIAQAKGEWMTEDFVPFEAPITIENYSGPATLVFIKSNPSGLPEHDDSVSFPINVRKYE